MTYQEAYQVVEGKVYPSFENFDQERLAIKETKNKAVKAQKYEEASSLRDREKELEKELGINSNDPVKIKGSFSMADWANMIELKHLEETHAIRNFLSLDKMVAVNSYAQFFYLGQRVLFDEVEGNKTGLILSFVPDEDEIIVVTTNGSTSIEFISAVKEQK